MIGAGEREARRRRTVARIRRVGMLVSAALLGAAVLLFNTVQVRGDATHEWLDGPTGGQSVLLPMVLFAVGTIGILICLPTRASRR